MHKLKLPPIVAPGLLYIRTKDAQQLYVQMHLTNELHDWIQFQKHPPKVTMPSVEKRQRSYEAKFH